MRDSYLYIIHSQYHKKNKKIKKNNKKIISFHPHQKGKYSVILFQRCPRKMDFFFPFNIFYSSFPLKNDTLFISYCFFIVVNNLWALPLNESLIRFEMLCLELFLNGTIKNVNIFLMPPKGESKACIHANLPISTSLCPPMACTL